MTRACFSASGIRRRAARRWAGTEWRLRCCSKFRWCWGATLRESHSRCATSARTAHFRFPSGGSIGKTSSAPITAGNSTRTPASAARIPSLTADSKLKCDRIYAGSFPCEERDGYVWVFMANPEGRAIGEQPPRAARIADIQRALQNRASLGRSALQRGPGHHRPDGSGARPVRASGLVVAQPAQHSRQRESISSRFPMAFA